MSAINAVLSVSAICEREKQEYEKSTNGSESLTQRGTPPHYINWQGRLAALCVMFNSLIEESVSLQTQYTRGDRSVNTQPLASVSNRRRPYTAWRA